MRILADISVFHGTKHDFDQFDTEAIGTGTGAQAFGWGIYFSDDKNTAESYRQSLSSGVLTHLTAKYGSDPSFQIIINDLKETKDVGLTQGNIQQVIDQEYANNQQHKEDIVSQIEALMYRKERYGLDILEEIEYEGLEALLDTNVTDFERIRAHEKALKAFDQIIEDVGDDLVKMFGRIYFADIPDDPYLVWDQYAQPAGTIEILNQNGISMKDRSGANIYNALVSQHGSPKAASQYLDSIGIVGNRHSIGGGYSNYIIFNAKNIKIVRKA